MSKRQLGVGWGVEAESRDTEVLNGDGSALSAATMKRRGCYWCLLEGKSEILDVL